MKRAFVIGMLAIMLCGCGSYNDYDTERDISDRFVNIPEERFLFYDINTKIIYYFMNGYLENDGCYSMPYISENGNYCRYIDGKIVEVE